MFGRLAGGAFDAGCWLGARWWLVAEPAGPSGGGSWLGPRQWSAARPAALRVEVVGWGTVVVGRPAGDAWWRRVWGWEEAARKVVVEGIGAGGRGKITLCGSSDPDRRAARSFGSFVKTIWCARYIFRI